jgi:hypothetical protein
MYICSDQGNDNFSLQGSKFASDQFSQLGKLTLIKVVPFLKSKWII